VSGSPEELLRSALEKVIFFECRVASLENELDAARTNAARSREEAGSARRRETELETLLAQARGDESAAAAHNAELMERVRLLEAERERFLSGMVERARVAGAPAGDGDAPGSEDDLAGFISELRAEIEELRAWKSAALASGVQMDPLPPPPARAGGGSGRGAVALPAMANSFGEAGRFGISRDEARSLQSFSTRSERVLYEASLDDLSAADPGRRRRAADGLRVLGSRGAAPLVAAALGREPDAEVKVALLAALGAIAEPGAADLALRELSDARPPVRAAALEAASALAKERAVPQLAGALGDASPLVRRRAVVLLGFTSGEPADDALASALSDRDAGVARAAAVALAGRPSARAQGALARALDHRAPEVRAAAARAVGRWSGETVDASAPEPERRRAVRRITEKLLAVNGAELRSAVMTVPATARVAPRAAPLPGLAAGAFGASARYREQPPASPSIEVGGSAPDTPAASGGRGHDSVATARRVSSPSPWKGEGRGEGRSAASVAAAATAVAVADPTPDPSLASAALTEVRAALRGRTADELAAALSRDRATVEAALRALVAQGRLLARGPRFFMS
jgi:HEAT repeats